MAGGLFIGTSGYVYPHWRRLFYSADLPQRRWLRFYAEHLRRHGSGIRYGGSHSEPMNYPDYKAGSPVSYFPVQK